VLLGLRAVCKLASAGTQAVWSSVHVRAPPSVQVSGEGRTEGAPVWLEDKNHLLDPGTAASIERGVFQEASYSLKTLN